MAWEKKLNGQTPAEVRTAVLATTRTFGWQVETVEPQIKDSWPAETEAIIAVFNITCKGDLYRLAITIQSRRDRSQKRSRAQGRGNGVQSIWSRQYCVMECWQSTVVGSPCVQDDNLYDRYEALGQAIAKAVQ